MAKLTPKLETSKPKNALTKPLKANFKDLFKALAKGIAHTAVGKWEEIGVDAIDALSAVGLTTEPGDLGFLLIRRSVTRALFDLVENSVSNLELDAEIDELGLIEGMNFEVHFAAIVIDQKIFERPADQAIVGEVQSILRKWLMRRGIIAATSEAIVARFPSYFVYALNQEWRRGAKEYTALLQAQNTPFTKAGEREWAWAEYSAHLQRTIHESIFDEPFSLSQIFVPLNAYYIDHVLCSEPSDRSSRTERRKVSYPCREKWSYGF